MSWVPEFCTQKPVPRIDAQLSWVLSTKRQPPLVYLRNNKVWPARCWGEQSPVLRIVVAAAIGKNVQSVVAAQTQRESTDIIDGKGKYFRRTRLKSCNKCCGLLVKSALAGRVPIVEGVAIGAVIVIAVSNFNKPLPAKSPSALNVDRPITNYLYASATSSYFAHFAKMQPKQVGSATDRTQRKSDERRQGFLDAGGITHSAGSPRRVCQARAEAGSFGITHRRERRHINCEFNSRVMVCRRSR